MERKHLPNRRKGYTQKFRINGHKIFLHTGEYEDGTLGEVFLDSPKEGTTLRGYLHTIAILISMGLQRGISIQEFSKTLKGFSFEPNGIVEGSEHVSECKSIIDCVLQELEKSYGSR